MSPLLRTFHSLALICALLGLPAFAQEPAPDQLIKSVSEEVLATLRSDRTLAADTARLARLVETRVVPHFDFRRAAQLAMGSSWRLASPEQQERVTAEFRSLLVRTYSGALAGYRDHAIEFKPLRARPGDAEVTVRSLVKQSGTEPIAIEYDLERSSSGWKVFDVRVAGISLVATYRSAFAEEVRNHGVDGLIKSLASKNRAS